MTRDDVSLICKAMSDANRLCIIEMLTTGEKCGCDLLDELQVAQSASYDKRNLNKHVVFMAEI